MSLDSRSRFGLVLFFDKFVMLIISRSDVFNVDVLLNNHAGRALLYVVPREYRWL